MDRLCTTTATNRGSSSNNFSNNYATNNHDAINAFRNAMFEYGITPPDHIIADGQNHRFKIDSKLNGFYRLHLDPLRLNSCRLKFLKKIKFEIRDENIYKVL